MSQYMTVYGLNVREIAFLKSYFDEKGFKEELTFQESLKNLISMWYIDHTCTPQEFMNFSSKILSNANIGYKPKMDYEWSMRCALSILGCGSSAFLQDKLKSRIKAEQKAMENETSI